MRARADDGERDLERELERERERERKKLNKSRRRRTSLEEEQDLMKKERQYIVKTV